MRDVERFRLVLHLAETLNYGRTAADCHVSTATLSRTVRRVELDTGVRLFERGPRGVALTEHGRHFCDYARASVELWESYTGGDRSGGRDEAADLAGRLRVFASPTAAQSIVPDLLAPLREAHPAVELDLRIGDASAAMSLLEEADADLAVAALPERVPGHLVSREIRRTPLVFVAAAPVENWESGPFVLPRSGLARAAADRWFRRSGVRPERVSEVDGHEAVLALVALGCGVGLVPRLVLDCSALRDRLVTVEPRRTAGTFRIGACVRRDDLHRPVVAAMWAITQHRATGVRQARPSVNLT